MVDRRGKLDQLKRLAELKSELELKRLSAFTAHVAAARQQISDAETAIGKCYASDAPLSIAEARVASLQAGDLARRAEQARGDLQRMLPRLEVARQKAAREFGRASALRGLADPEGKG